jgi:hypothetical protein
MVQYITASVRGMQGVAAKNDASYDPMPGTDTVAFRGVLPNLSVPRSRDLAIDSL